MGNRTVVVLYNDQTQEWENDPALGKKISIGMNYVHSRSIQPSWESKADLHYGRVVECAHADTYTLAVLSGYQFKPLVYNSWYNRSNDSEVELTMVRMAAEKLGYRLTKIQSPKDKK